MSWGKVLVIAFAIWASATAISDGAAPMVERLCEVRP